MRLALLIALAPDRRSGRVLSGLMPADKAFAEVKQAIIDDECPDLDFPVLQAVAIDAKLREHRFTPTPAQVEAFRAKADLKPTSTTTDLIVVELGEGDEKVIINVTTDEEAAFIKDLAASAAGAEKIILERNERIGKLNGSLVVAGERIARLEDELKRETAFKAERNQRIATLEADLKKAQEAAEPKAKLATLEADLKKAQEAPEPKVKPTK